MLNRIADAGRPASALRGGERDPHLRRSPRSSAAAGCSRSTSPGSSWPTGRRAPIPRSSASTTRSTWLCQIVMFLVLGLLVTPTHALGLRAAGRARRAGPDLRRPAARGLALPGALRLRAATRSSSSPGSACAARSRSSSPRSRRSPACRTRRAYFNIAFFVVLLSLLVQGSTLTTRRAPARAWRCGRRPPAPSRVEIDIPGQTEQEIVGYPVTADSVILGLSRLPAWARVIMVVRKGHILDAAEARRAPARRLRLLPRRPRAAAAARQPVPRQPRRGAAARAALRRAADPRRDPGRRGRAVLRPRPSAPHAPDVDARRLGRRRGSGKPGARRRRRGPRRQARGAPPRVRAHRQHGPAARRAAAGRARREAPRPARAGGRRARRPSAAGCAGLRNRRA